MFQILKGFSLIMLFYLIGELITSYLVLPVPGNVLGMLMLFSALQAKMIKSEDIELVAMALVALLNLFFVPAGVGLLAYEQLLLDNLTIILISSVISLLIVMWVAAKLFLLLKK